MWLRHGDEPRGTLGPRALLAPDDRSRIVPYAAQPITGGYDMDHGISSSRTMAFHLLHAWLERARRLGNVAKWTGWNGGCKVTMMHRWGYSGLTVK